MVDFVASLQKGINSAEQVEINIIEIDSVFDELNKQLQTAYDGKVFIKRVAKNRPRNILYIDTMDSDLAVSNPKKNINKKSYNLAEWKQSKHGYPCTIIFDNQKYICEDKESLENCLADLLAEPLVANKIMKVINNS